MDDNISHLPDDLLLRILSLNTTKEVMATSLLSRRWRSLWTLVPGLKYEDNDHNGDYKLFTQFVYKYWIMYFDLAVSRHLRQLHIDIRPSKIWPVTLPRSLYTSETLQRLTLINCVFLDVLVHVRLPSLKTLSLKFVTYADNTSLQRLLTGCPNLEILSVEQCFGLWVNLALSHHVRELHIHIRSSKKRLYTSETLQSLTLIKCVPLDVPVHVRLLSLKTLSLKFVTYADKASLQRLLSGCSNLEVLSVEHRLEDSPMDVTVVLPSLQRLHMSHNKTRGTYVLNLPSLKYLKCSGMTSSNLLQIENMPELVTAHVIFRGATHKFLKALTSVRRLKLWITLPEVMNPSGMIFNQLVHLDFYIFREGWWDLLTCMLQDSPKLRFLKLINKLDKGIFNYRGREITTGWKQPSSVPECLLHSLEAFEWFGYKGRHEDREMATYVLKNATCLKTATFSPKSKHLGKKYRMPEELASVATASASCQLLFD
ncbi:hypothetical protein Bca4012_015167 [Brassica carinata]